MSVERLYLLDLDRIRTIGVLCFCPCREGSVVRRRRGAAFAVPANNLRLGLRDVFLVCYNPLLSILVLSASVYSSYLLTDKYASKHLDLHPFRPPSYRHGELWPVKHWLRVCCLLKGTPSGSDVAGERW